MNGRRTGNADEGAGSVLAVGLAGAVVAGFLLVAGAASVLEAHQRVVSAADAAALAGADVELGAATGLPCAAASAMAAQAEVRLVRCDVRGQLVRVRLATSALGVPLTAEALAGPPPPR